MSDSLWPHGLQHTRLPLSPRVCSNSCLLSQWCHWTISSSLTPFSSCPQSFPASESFPVSQLFALSGQSDNHFNICPLRYGEISLFMVYLFPSPLNQIIREAGILILFFPLENIYITQSLIFEAVQLFPELRNPLFNFTDTKVLTPCPSRMYNSLTLN